MPEDPKDIGKFVLGDNELETLGSAADMTPPQGSSQVLVLKELLDGLLRELEQTEQQRQNVLKKILTINEIFKEKLKAQQVAAFKERRTG